MNLWKDGVYRINNGRSDAKLYSPGMLKRTALAGLGLLLLATPLLASADMTSDLQACTITPATVDTLTTCIRGLLAKLNELKVAQTTTSNSSATTTIPTTTRPSGGTPSCTITAEKSAVTEKEPVALSWTTQNAESATLNAPGFYGFTIDALAQAKSGTYPFKAYQVNSFTTYTITVKNALGNSATCSTGVTMSLIPVPAPTTNLGTPSCTITADKSAITDKETVALSWTTQNAESATFNAPGFYGFTFDALAQAKSGNYPLKAYQVNSFTTYTITVKNALGNSATCSTSVTMTPVPTPAPTTNLGTPSCTITANKTMTTDKEPIVLEWTTENAASAILNGTGIPTYGYDALQQAKSGTYPFRIFALNSTARYSITVRNATGATATCSTPTITVTPTPTATLTVETVGGTPTHDITVNVGETNIKRWSSTGGTSWVGTYSFAGTCAQAGGTGTWVGGNTAEGSSSGAPGISKAGCTSTITYTVTGPGGTASDTIHVTTAAAPTSYNSKRNTQVAGAAAAIGVAPTAQVGNFSHTFTEDLFRGETGAEVSALQQALKTEGLFNTEVTGNFYDNTREAVMAFQLKYGINPTGYVGPATRTKLNELY